MSKNQIISLRIIAAIEAGMTLPQAIDSVLGAGSYESAAGAIYDALIAKA